MTDHTQELDAIARELARQDSEWEAARAQIVALGDCTLGNMEETLLQIDEACAVRAACSTPINGLRG